MPAKHKPTKTSPADKLVKTSKKGEGELKEEELDRVSGGTTNTLLQTVATGKHISKLS